MSPTADSLPGAIAVATAVDPVAASGRFYETMRRRRTIRSFSTRAVPKEAIQKCLLVAGTAPSGANLQPWLFVALGDAALKKKLRKAAEGREKEFYGGRAGQDWLDAVAPFGTSCDKPFLEQAPWIIAVFSENYRLASCGKKQSNYYPRESTGIATGLLIAALHNAGLATLTYTPSPMAFVRDLLGVSKNYQPFMLVVTGYPATAAPPLSSPKKSLQEICRFI